MPREKKSAPKRRRVHKKDPMKMSLEGFLDARQEELPGSVPLKVVEHFLGVKSTRRLNFTTKYSLGNVNPCTDPYLVHVSAQRVTTESIRKCLKDLLEKQNPGLRNALALAAKAGELREGAL